MQVSFNVDYENDVLSQCFAMNILCDLRHKEELAGTVSDKCCTVRKKKAENYVYVILEYGLLLIITAGYIISLFFSKLRFNNLTKTSNFVRLH